VSSQQCVLLRTGNHGQGTDRPPPSTCTHARGAVPALRGRVEESRSVVVVQTVAVQGGTAVPGGTAAAARSAAVVGAVVAGTQETVVVAAGRRRCPLAGAGPSCM